VVKKTVSACFGILPILTLFCLSSVSIAAFTTNPTLVFKMTADKTALLPGEQTAVHIWAWIYTPDGMEKPNNGLDTWQLDLSVNNNNVISITSLTVLAPNPSTSYPPYQISSLNNPITGEVRSVAVVQKVYGAPSLTGVGMDDNIDNQDNYTEICQFMIQAMLTPESSSATYTIMNEGTQWFGYLADGTLFDNDDISANGGTFFYAAGSDNEFTIIPEPASMVLLATAAAFALRRRK
jgi:hypothetical protein